MNNIIDLLNIIGNETRRKIIQLLSYSECYLTELSSILNIENRALLRHLQTMMRNGLLDTYMEKNARGRPPRKYYRLSKSYQIKTIISPEVFKTVIYPIEPEQEFPKVQNLPDLQELYDAYHKVEPNNSFTQLISLAQTLNSYIDSLERLEAGAIFLYRKIIQELYDTLSYEFDPMSAMILKILIINGGKMKLEDLKAQIATEYDKLKEVLNLMQKHNLIKFEGEIIYVE